MAGAMMAAAALGLVGSKATTFVMTPSSQAPVSAPIASASTGYQSAAAAAPLPSSQAFCSGLAVGMVGAAASIKKASKTRMAAAYDASKALGAMAPIGYWDPCGLMKERVGKDGWQWKDEKTFEQYRVAELKHGRVAMLAATGLMVNSVWKFPTFEGVPDGFAALQESQGGAGFGLIFLLASYFEITTPKGDFKDPLNLGFIMAEDMDELRKKELNNGRVGMAATITFFLYDYGEKISPSMKLAATDMNEFFFPLICFLLVAGPASSKIWTTEQAAVKQVTLKPEVPKVEEKVTKKIAEKEWNFV